jgi:hypothetical protein
MKYQSISVPTQHQIRVAKNTLHLSDAGARALGGMTKDAAREVLALEAGWSQSRIARFENV